MDDQDRLNQITDRHRVLEAFGPLLKQGPVEIGDLLMALRQVHTDRGYLLEQVAVLQKSDTALRDRLVEDETAFRSEISDMEDRAAEAEIELECRHQNALAAAGKAAQERDAAQAELAQLRARVAELAGSGCTARGGGAVMRCRCGARLAGVARARGSCRRCETARRRGLSLLALGGAAGLDDGRRWASLGPGGRRSAREALRAWRRAELARLAEDPIAGRARRLSLLLWVARLPGGAGGAPRKVCERCRGPARSGRGGVVLCRLCAPSWRAARRRRALRARLAVALAGESRAMRLRLLAPGCSGRGGWARRARSVLVLCELAEEAARFLG